MSAIKPTIIDADHVSLRIGSQTILDNVSFAIPEGTYVGIVGPNGGGKTTLLKTIIGLRKPTAGTIAVFGEPPQKARLAGKIGYVPQRVAQEDFQFPATVEEIVQSGRISTKGFASRFTTDDLRQIEKAMGIAGIIDLRKRLVGTLSGGQRQKVFIARSLAADPKLLILDEPTTGIDPAAKEQFYALLKRLNQEFGLTILFVSHDIEVVTKEVSFVLALNQKLLCHCSSHEFLSEETLKRLYGREVEPLHQHFH